MKNKFHTILQCNGQETYHTALRHAQGQTRNEVAMTVRMENVTYTMTDWTEQ